MAIVKTIEPSPCLIEPSPCLYVFIDGGHFYDDFGYDNCVADDSHPNTLGLFAMATKIASVLEQAIDIKKI